MVKAVSFCGDSLDALRSFPTQARRDAGYQIDRLQRGYAPDDWKPMPSIGSGVCEIRLRDRSGAFRVIYLARLDDAIHIIHCFQKKTQKTASSDIEVARQRYRELIRKQP